MLLFSGAACGDKRPPPEKKPAPAPATVARAPAAEPKIEPDAEPPLPPVEVLSGAAAERAIAAEPAPAAPTAEASIIGPSGVGPYRLGLPRNALIALGKPRITRLGSDPTVERAELAGMTARILAGRLVELTVTGRGPRTGAGIGVGSTLAEAVEAHGEPRPSGPGVVLADLPGVIFVVEGGVIARVTIVGPESD
jgi:hypothetical protein